MAQRYNIDEVGDIKEKEVFFDANIIIYLFWSTGRSQQYLEAKYASIFSELFAADIPMYINYIVISEIVNRTLRISWEKHLDQNNLSKKQLNFKAYRNSDAGQQSQDDISVIIKDLILEQFSVIDDSFSKGDIIDLLDDNSLDFSDKAILKTCKDNNYILVTHDADYSNSDIDILSCNRKIIQS